MRLALLLLALSGPALCQPLTLHYTHPAEDWQSQALPIGNGRLGAMIFGGAPPGTPAIERNLTVDRRREGYRTLSEPGRSLPRSRPWGAIRLPAGAGHLHRHPHHLLHGGRDRLHARILRLRTATRYWSSDSPRITPAPIPEPCAWPTRTMRRWPRRATGSPPPANSITVSSTKPRSDSEYRRVAHPGDGTLRISRADSLTILVDAGTNYLPDRAHAWRGDDPHARVSAQLRAAAARSFDDLRGAHLNDYQRLFRRVSLDLGGDPGANEVPTDERLAATARAPPTPRWKPCSSSSAATC